jgi:hypothetical protein
MYKYLLGPVVSGAAYAAGAYYGADAEQLVRKSPETTYASVEQMLGNLPASGTTGFEGGTPIPYQLRIDRTPDERLVATLSFGGRDGASADFRFAPAGDGQATLVIAKIHGDHAVLRQVLSGTSKAKLAYAPDWMLNLTARPLLRQLAAQIEKGEGGNSTLPGFQSQADWEASLPPDEQQQLQAWHQYEATKPVVDPNAAARKYLNGGGSD